MKAKIITLQNDPESRRVYGFAVCENDDRIYIPSHVVRARPNMVIGGVYDFDTTPNERYDPQTPRSALWTAEDTFPILTVDQDDEEFVQLADLTAAILLDVMEKLETITTTTDRLRDQIKRAKTWIDEKAPENAER